MLEKSYEMEKGPPPALIADYIRSSREGYEALLSGEPSEADIQSFLEKHPWMVPGHSTPTGVTGHYPLHCSLIAQPELPGKPSYVPDFMWVSTHSDSWFPTLIEIEKPSKRIFTKKGDTSADFNHARDQLNQWRSWFSEPENIQVFITMYGIPDRFRGRTMKVSLILIYGRSSEFEDNPTLTKKRSGLAQQDEIIMSFDRLKDTDPSDALVSEAITVKAKGQGEYQALWIPSVFTNGPNLAERLLKIDAISEAIDKNPEISEERKIFLKRRIPYWKEWAASSGLKVKRPSDWE